MSNHGNWRSTKATRGGGARPNQNRQYEGNQYSKGQAHNHKQHHHNEEKDGLGGSEYQSSGSAQALQNHGKRPRGHRGYRNQGSGSEREWQNYPSRNQSGNWRGNDNQGQNYHNNYRSGGLGGYDDSASTQQGQNYNGNRSGGRGKNRQYNNERTHQSKHESTKEIEHPDFVFFWGKQSPFSQFHQTQFKVGDNIFMCAEQFMMFKKAELFKDRYICEKVLQTEDPRQHKKLGREVRNFDKTLWEENCLQIVKEGNFAKFMQNERLKKELLSTGNKTLVEASPHDNIWGIGLAANDERALTIETWEGENRLGYALTEVREEIKRLELEKMGSSKQDTENKEKMIGGARDVQKDTKDFSCVVDATDSANTPKSKSTINHADSGGTSKKETKDPMSESININQQYPTEMSTRENATTNNKTQTEGAPFGQINQVDRAHQSNKGRNNQPNECTGDRRKRNRVQGPGWANDGQNDKKMNRNQRSEWSKEGQNDEKDNTSGNMGRHNFGEHPDFVFFWQKHSPFSQWHESKFTVGDNAFSCAEQFMMFKKAELFKDAKVCKKVLQTFDPREHKKLGRQVQNFNQKLWDERCFDIVKEGNFAKFTQNESLKKELLSTGNKTLVEASPLDKIWGIGLAADDERAWNKETWKGQNLLGYALTEVREKIKMLELGTKEGAAESKCKDKPIREADKGPEIATNLNDTKATVEEIPVNNENDIEMMDTTDSTTSNDESRTELNSNSSANTKMSASTVAHEQSEDNGEDPLVPQNENGGNSADTGNQVTNETLPETNSFEMQTNKTEAIDASNPPCSLENSIDKEVDEVNKDSNDGEKMDTKESTSSSCESAGEFMSKPTAQDHANETIPHENSPCVKNDNEESNDANRLSRENELQTMDTTDSANAATPPVASLTQTQGEEKLTFAEMLKRKK